MAAAVLSAKVGRLAIFPYNIILIFNICNFSFTLLKKAFFNSKPGLKKRAEDLLGVSLLEAVVAEKN